MSLTIRSATSNDTAWYLDLVRSLATEPEPQIPLGRDEHFRTPEQQAELFGGASARGDLFLIAEWNGERVGEVNLRRGSRPAFKHSAALGIAVARPSRGKGIGLALMEKAMEWAKGDGALRRIELNVFATNATAIRLYERCGFVVEGRRKDAVRVGDGFVDDVVMAYLI
jgi:RimJ/RimL family protein N-acetyltransferase